jgi:2-dehydropantoate 2-reductase
MMRVLVLGAGAVGGYFGGRLLEAGSDVAFLVRAARADQLRKSGLVIRSPLGDARLEAPVVLTENPGVHFDLVLLSCKAYDLEPAIESIAPAVGPGTAILPLLNGMRHLEALDRRFGAERVLGGVCAIAATLNADGAIVHLTIEPTIRFGERNGAMSERVAAIAELMAPAKMVSVPSRTIVQDMWEKWVMLASLAGITCLMRASIGDIVAAPGGNELVLQLLEECAAVATAYGFAPRPASLDRGRAVLTETGSTFTASMLRDIERGGRTEGDHILGDLIARAEEKSIAVPLLRTAYCHVKVYERRIQ